jgi:hypothetical protein
MGFMGPASEAVAENVHLIEVDYGSVDAGEAELYRRVTEELEAQFVRTRSSEETLQLVRHRSVWTVDTNADRYLVESLDPLAVGRELFFAGEFEAAIDLILPRVNIVWEHPHLLATRRDLAPVLLDSALVLAQAFSQLGMTREVGELLEKLAALFPVLEPTQAAISPDWIDRFTSIRDEQLTRSVRIEWNSEEDCDLYVNGAPAFIESGGSIRVSTQKDTYLQWRCGMTWGMVLKLETMQEELHWDLELDSALGIRDEHVVLRPRSQVDAAMLPSLVKTTAGWLEEGVVSYGKVSIVPGEPEAVEIAFARSDAGFRAIRIPVEHLDDSEEFSAALAYVLGRSSHAPEPAIVWENDPAWVSRGVWSPEDARDGRQRHTTLAATGWSLTVAGLASGVVATHFLLSKKSGEDAIADCSLETCLGTSDIAALRDDVRSDRRRAIALGAVSGVSMAAGVTALVVRRHLLRSDRRGFSIESASVGLSPGGVRADVSLRF